MVCSQTSLDTLDFLRDLKSSRVEEFRAACDSKFEIATVFKPSEELPTLRRTALGMDIAQADGEKAEVVS